MMTQETNFPPCNDSDAGRSLTRSRLTLLGIVATFVVPLVLALVLYARLDIWKPSSYVNHGRLMEPVAPLGFLEAVGQEGDALSLHEFDGHWTLIYLAEGACGIQCQSQLFKMRQSRAMLGRDLVRVNTFYLALGSEATSSFDVLAAEHPALRVGQVSADSIGPQKQAFSAEEAGRFYLLDPLGNLVLEYDEQSTTKGVLKDLKRLLKVSNIG